MSQTTTLHMRRFFTFSDLIVRLSQNLLALTFLFIAPSFVLAQYPMESLTVNNPSSCSILLHYVMYFSGGTSSGYLNSPANSSATATSSSGNPSSYRSPNRTRQTADT